MVGSRSERKKKSGMVNKSQKQVQKNLITDCLIDEGTKKADKAEGNKS
jgi:hypothetical protein